MNKNKDKIGCTKELESLREFDENIEVLCFDKRSLKLKYKSLKSMHRHKMNRGEKLFRITTVGGREVKATEYHSVFTMRNSKIVPVKVKE